jgi:peptide-methionine (S)-S-oxide reductase
MRQETAIFAAGCFWSVEADFRDIPGVLDAEVGYTGGATVNPTYREICTGRTGHAEAVRVTYDAERVSFATLADAFFELHDPTQLNRQGPDIGPQYRSAIFYVDDAQRVEAEAAKERAGARHARPVVTQLVPAEPFYAAEDYHQRFLEKRGLRTCRV